MSLHGASALSILTRGFYFAERHPETTFFRVVYHFNGHEATWLDFLESGAVAQAIARRKNLDPTPGGAA